MAARSSASTPPVSANTVCTAQPRSCSHGTQKLVSRPPLKARTMSREEPGMGNGEWGMEGALLMAFSREMEIEGVCGKSMHSPHSLLTSITPRGGQASKLGRAPCRERVSQSVSASAVGGTLKQKATNNQK